MTYSTRYASYLPQSLAHHGHHNGLCKICTESELADEKHRLHADLFASLDDDTDLLFGYGVEDY